MWDMGFVRQISTTPDWSAISIVLVSVTVTKFGIIARLL